MSGWYVVSFCAGRRKTTSMIFWTKIWCSRDLASFWTNFNTIPNDLATQICFVSSHLGPSLYRNFGMARTNKHNSWKMHRNHSPNRSNWKVYDTQMMFDNRNPFGMLKLHGKIEFMEEVERSSQPVLQPNVESSAVSEVGTYFGRGCWNLWRMDLSLRAISWK